MTRAWLPIFAMLYGCGAKVAELVVTGDDKTLRSRPATERRDPAAPILLLALDGVPRELLYSMARAHQLPNFSALIGKEAYFDESLLATMPSTTMPAWVSTITGEPPAVHGVTGNEYFIRETTTLACPAPESFDDTEPTLSIYTDRYLDKLIEVPTVYERMRRQDPNVMIWVAMNHVFRGADKLVLAKRGVLVKAFASILDFPASKTRAMRKVFTAVDEKSIDSVIESLGGKQLPDVLTVYLSGTDLYAHVAHEGPDEAMRWYLKDVVDPALGKLVAKLRERGMLARMWTVVVADHGHSPVVHDKTHALRPSRIAERVLQGAGFRTRLPARDSPNDTYSAVVAYGGATAYVYLADRSTCATPKDDCTWKLPPRYREDVLVAAEAFKKHMGDKLDMILTREPKPFGEVDGPFEVYIGDGQTVPVEEYLLRHPHPTYVATAERLRQLAVGPHGERAGDILLLAHYGDVEKEQRFYFAHEYRSWHGSPARADSEIPLIVANHGVARDEIAAHVKATLGDEPFQMKVAELLFSLRQKARATE